MLTDLRNSKTKGRAFKAKNPLENIDERDIRKRVKTQRLRRL